MGYCFSGMTSYAFLMNFFDMDLVLWCFIQIMSGLCALLQAKLVLYSYKWQLVDPFDSVENLKCSEYVGGVKTDLPPFELPKIQYFF